MNLITSVAAAVLAVSALALSNARAGDLSQAVLLVASQKLNGSSLEETVVIAMPLPNAGHIGLIVNRPTSVKLETLFADDAQARKVTAPVHYGRPALTRGVFALMAVAPDVPASGATLIPGVVAVLDYSTLRHVIDTRPDAARYFIGMMVWDPNELDEQVADGQWDVRAADADSVLTSDAPGLWNALRLDTGADGTASERGDRFKFTLPCPP